MRPHLGIVLNRNRFSQLAESVNECVMQAVRESALDVVRDAKSHAPVDTGALREGIYAVTTEWSGYGQAASAAHSKNPKAKILPPLTVSNPTEAGVGMAVDYWIFQEFGTRFMPAHPFLTPAVNAQQAKFNRRMDEALHGRCNNIDPDRDFENLGGEAEAAEVGEAAEVAEVAVIAL